MSEQQDKFSQRILQEGKDAHSFSKKLSDNPYPQFTNANFVWEKGWNSYAPQDIEYKSTLPTELFDAQGNKYVVHKPKYPDPDNWVRLYKEGEHPDGK